MIENRQYIKSDVISFYKTDEEFGLLSNMKGRLYFKINNIIFYSSESIYQSLRYPHNIELQKKIASEKSPLIGKRIAQSHKEQTREDWDIVKNNIMRIAIRIKFLKNINFRELLLSTGNKDIVEISKKDDYWGTIEKKDIFEGRNVLGRLLMELRKEETLENVKRRLEYMFSKTDKLLINGIPLSVSDILNETHNNFNNDIF
jgi:ribA/ribD-fused uncharacterized protein